MKIASTAPGALQILWQESVFREAKELRTITAELSKRGYNFSETNLAKALARCKFLTRRGARGSFTYIQK